MNTEMKIIAFTANMTPVYTHPEAHPHRPDIAAEAIEKMVVPAEPEDKNDRAKTRHCETIDMGRKIGKNHLVKVTWNDETTMYKRGDRNYESRIALFKRASAETRLTSVLFYVDNKWVLFTNFEGEQGLPEPGCDRYNKMTKEEKNKCDEFWQNHALVLEGEERKEMIKNLKQKYCEERRWLDSYLYAMSGIEWDARNRELNQYYRNVILKLK